MDYACGCHFGEKMERLLDAESVLMSQRCKNLKNHKKRENGFLGLTKSFMNLIPRGSSKLLLTTCCSRVCGIAEGLRYLLVGL